MLAIGLAEPKPQEHVGSPSPRPSISWAEAVHGSPSPDQQSAVPEDRNSPHLEQMQMLMMQMLQRMTHIQESQDTFSRQMQHMQEDNRSVTGEMQS